eukprot:234496_1
MAEEKQQKKQKKYREETTQEPYITILCLICPGLKPTDDTSRKVAMKSGGKKNPGVGDGNVTIDLKGCKYDARTLSEYAKKESKNMAVFISEMSHHYHSLTYHNITTCIGAWVCLSTTHCRVRMLYFTGHGGPSGLCLGKGQLPYQFLALFLGEAANCKEMEKWSKPLIMIIDACHSGSVVNYFKNIKKPKILIHYSCGADEVSADCGVGEGGWFTREFFKRNDFGKPLPGTIHTYKGGKKEPQTPGLWKNF